MAKYQKNNTNIKLPVQQININAKWKEITSAFRIDRNKLIWEGVVKPTEISRQYKLKIIYKHESEPSVYLLEPKFIELNDQNPPHIYNYDEQRLCLYYPQYREWTNQMLISDTIIPWAIEWLLHYEIWLSTGEWQGGGIHPSSS